MLSRCYHKNKKEQRKLWEVLAVSITLIVWWYHGCLHMSKLIKVYALSVQVFAYQYTSIKLLKKNTDEKKQHTLQSLTCNFWGKAW